MSHLIYTRDIFFHEALCCLVNSISCRKPLCIIDIDTFTGLREISLILQEKSVSERYRVILVGGKNVTSRILEPLVTLNRKSSLSEFRSQLAKGLTLCPDYILVYFIRCLHLKMLTSAERRVFRALTKTNDIYAASGIACLSAKTCYSHSRSIGEKLNLSTILQLRQFIFNDFVQHGDDMAVPAAVIEEHVPVKYDLMHEHIVN